MRACAFPNPPASICVRAFSQVHEGMNKVRASSAAIRRLRSRARKLSRWRAWSSLMLQSIMLKPAKSTSAARIYTRIPDRRRSVVLGVNADGVGRAHTLGESRHIPSISSIGEEHNEQHPRSTTKCGNPFHLRKFFRERPAPRLVSTIFCPQPPFKQLRLLCPVPL